MKKLEVGVIGLGKFGLQLGTSLMGFGHSVIGIDEDPGRVRLAQDMLTKVYEGDAADMDVLKQLRFQDLDTVAVSVGRSMDASILVCLNLQELGVKKIITKAINLAHAKVLTRLGVHKVVQPEVDVAKQVAMRLHNPGMLELLPVGGGILVQELIVGDWEGKTLIDLGLMTRHKVLVLAIQQQGDDQLRFVPDPSAVLAKGDKLVVVGSQEAVLSLVP